MVTYGGALQSHVTHRTLIFPVCLPVEANQSKADQRANTKPLRPSNTHGFNGGAENTGVEMRE